MWFECFDAMTFVAGASERPLVDVVGGMAGGTGAIERRLHCTGFAMTRLACERLVRADQSELCLFAMVEGDMAPTIRIVTLAA